MMAKEMFIDSTNFHVNRAGVEKDGIIGVWNQNAEG
jgi:hypothetical protein